MPRFTPKQLLPKGRIISAPRCAALWGAPMPSKVTYGNAPMLHHEAPLLPIMPFGIAYDLDLVIVTRHPAWDMHELARLITPEGPVWIAKDARSDTLEQSIVCDIEGLSGWLPELPVPRYASHIEVMDESVGQSLDLTISWSNPLHMQTRVHYRGEQPRHPQRKRNGSTMGHSRASLIAALDLSHRTWARRVDVSYDGIPAKLHRLFGIKPFAMSLLQTQGGFATGHFTQQDQPDNRLLVTHQRASERYAQLWEIRSAEGITTVVQDTPFRTITFHFLERGDHRELYEISVSQFSREHLTMRARFAPALPDLRFPFGGAPSARWIMDINGQEAHATGTLDARWCQDGLTMHVRPEAPWWVADRPMHIKAEAHEAGTEVCVTRLT